MPPRLTSGDPRDASCRDGLGGALGAGRAQVATGRSFSPGDVTYAIAQADDAPVFRGLDLGVTVARARLTCRSR
jgi:hypothetical protein